MNVLANLLARLPRIGAKTAEMLAAAIGEQASDYKEALAREILGQQPAVPCCICGDVSTVEPCSTCSNPARDPAKLMVVRTTKDREAVDRTGLWRGGYHVLRGLLDPIHGVGGEQLTARALFERLRSDTVREVVFGLGGSDRARTTTTWLAGLIPPGIALYELGVGIQFGHQLEDADPEAIAASLRGRKEVRA